MRKKILIFYLIVMALLLFVILIQKIEGASNTISISQYNKISARHYVLARCDYNESNREEQSTVEMYKDDVLDTSYTTRTIMLLHFNGNGTSEEGYTVSNDLDVSYTATGLWGNAAQFNSSGSKIEYTGSSIPSLFSDTRGTVLMWVAPNTQTVRFDDRVNLFYSESDDGSWMALQL